MLLLGNITRTQMHPDTAIQLLQLGKQRLRKEKQHVQGHAANQ